MAKGRIRRWLYTREFILATHLATLGGWWADSAAARLKRLRRFFFHEIG